MKKLLLVSVSVISISACRGQVSEEPPVHILPDMQWQPKLLQQGESDFFADHRAMRTPPEGTIARGNLKEDTAFYQGKVDGSYINKIPFDVDEKVIGRGQQRFNIYCAVCHDQTGGGNGAAAQHGVPYGMPKPLSIYADHARSLSDGEIFDVISNGSHNHNMPAYGPQIPEKDRWSIISWVRVLQRAGHGSISDVPGDQRNAIAPEEPAQ